MRQDRTPEELGSAANDFQQIAIYLRNVAAKMRTAQMPTLLIHSSTSFNRIPALIEWARKVDIEVDSQISAYQRGVESRHAIDKRRDDAVKATRVKSAAAKE